MFLFQNLVLDGAALFYTSSSQPTTYTQLRTYLLHRLYSSSSPSSAPLHAHAITTIGPTSTRFPFPYRANVLDRDHLVVPAGWDSWNKIDVLKDGFEKERIAKAWSVSLEKMKRKREREEEGSERKGGDVGGRIGRGKDGDEEENGGTEEDVEELWAGIIPNPRDHLAVSFFFRSSC